MMLRHNPLRLISAPMMLVFATAVLFYEVEAPFYYQRYFGVFDGKTIPSLLFLDLYTLFLFFLVPLIVGRVLFREPYFDLGLRRPLNNWVALRLILLAYCIVIPLTLFCAHQSQFKHYYSFGHVDTVSFIFMQLVLVPVYYFSEEFFFRGFLFLSLWRRIGWHSFWVTDIFFTLAHLGKPGIEIILSIPASVMLNYLTLRTRSIYPALIVHATIGIAMNMTVN
ncbi:MAG: CPBP family intramembrane metalloprotease [Gammaproteobacteria bacterium]|nr:MAG: CPBP family intramembrane metalloprotease [Gammaproteobacteria bacterium]